MPELPEVQTIINYLKDNILNQTILDIEIKNHKFIKNVSTNEFINNLKNKIILDIDRKGKYLIFKLSNNLYMIVHLRMEGKFFIDNKKVERKHDYIIFKLSNNIYLSYNDSRQFGTFHLTNEPNKLKEINKIALDPLNDNFDFHYFHSKVSKSNKNIKSILLDQTIVSGIGNIYASEILFESNISPFKTGKQLSKKEIEHIIEASKKILKLALKYNGTTIHTFSFGNNKTGDFTKYLKVVNRENKNCLICNTKIKRIKQQSRSTFYCDKCQK